MFLNKHSKFLSMAIAIVLVFSMLLSGCQVDSLLPGGPSTSTPSSSSPSNPPTQDKTEIVLNQAELVYEMTDEDVTKFYDLLKDCKDAALGGQDGDAVMALSDQVDDQYEYMYAQQSIATVLYYCDLNDEAASELYLDCTDTITEAYDAYMEMAKALYDAEFPAKERFFEEWSEQDIAMLLAYTPEVVQLQQRNSEIEVDYQDLQDDPDMYTKMVPLYIELVQNNNRIAQIYGYENYYIYAYELVYGRDYGSEEIAIMRSLTSTYLPEATTNAMNNFTDTYGNLGPTSQMKLSGFLFESYKNSYTDEIEDYFKTLPQQARLDMLDMFDGNIIITDNESAQEGAFTTAIGPDRHLCFFGPGYSNPLTVIHEVGHYYGAKHTELSDLPLDLAETQSQGNEWLFMSFMEEKMTTKFYEATVSYKTYNDLVTILLCVIIDEFEERVYTHPDIANLTCDDLDDLMEDVCKNYGGISFLNGVATDIQNYWRLVVIEQPVYYISYGVSAIAAMNIFTVAEEDYQKGVDVYCRLIEGVVLDDGFLGNISKAGLDGPFDEDVYKKFAEMMK